jgi:uncharacterized protein with PIN domain
MPIAACDQCRKMWGFDRLEGAERCPDCRGPVRRASLDEATARLRAKKGGSTQTAAAPPIKK